MTAGQEMSLWLLPAIVTGLALLVLLVWLANRSLRRAVEFDRRLDVPRAVLSATQRHHQERVVRRTRVACCRTWTAPSWLWRR